MSEASKMNTGQVPRDEYVKANLVSEMRRHRGRKRLRKKKAKRALRHRWGFLQFGRLLSLRINYAEIIKIQQKVARTLASLMDESYIGSPLTRETLEAAASKAMGSPVRFPDYDEKTGKATKVVSITPLGIESEGVE